MEPITTPLLPSSSPSSLDSSDLAPGLSIYQITRLHCRERLIVHPLEWTDRHLELLQCVFGQPFRAPVLTCQDDLRKILEENPGAGFVRRLGENYSGREAQLLSIIVFGESPFICHR